MSEAANKSAEAHVPGRGRIYDSITETIGDTPLVRIKRLAAENGAKADVLLKLEFFNPIASVKDRIGMAIEQRLHQRRQRRLGGGGDQRRNDGHHDAPPAGLEVRRQAGDSLLQRGHGVRQAALRSSYP